MLDSSPSRRRFLIRSAAVVAAAPLLGRIALQPAQAQDLPPVPIDNPTAVALAYAEDVATVKHPSLKPGSDCANCQFYVHKEGSARGPCTLFPNYSVAAKGWCTAWAKKP